MENNMKRAQGIVEIAITIAVIVVVTIAAFTPMGESISNLLSKAAPVDMAQQRVANANTGLDNFEGVVGELRSVNPFFEDHESGNVNNNIETTRYIINGEGDIGGNDIRNLLKFFNEQGGVEVSGVLSRFLLNDLSDIEKAEYASSLGLSSNASDSEILEALGLDGLDVELNDAVIQAFSKALVDKASKASAPEEIKSFATDFDKAVNPVVKSKEVIDVLDKNAKLIYKDAELRQLYLNLISVK